jgi:type I restriction enzyme S subunit
LKALNGSIDNKELPKDWKWVKLGEVCKLKNGFAFKSGEYKNDGIPVIRISDIKLGNVTPDKSVRVSEQKLFDDYIVKSNEILVAMSGATTGKFGIYKSSEKAYQNQRVGKFQILDEEKLDNSFLLYQLHALKRQIEKDAYGGAQPNISSGKIEAMEILLPPKPTQLAIVSKIEELFSEIENGIKSLLTAKEQLKKYRQSVLKWAFEGKLSESGFTRLKDEQDSVNKGILQSSNSENPDSDKGELPEGWKIVKIEDAVISLDNKRKPINKEERKKRVGSIPYYGANGQVGWIDDYISDEPLICVVEDETFTGREIPFSYKITGKTWVNNHAHVLKPKDNLNIDFLNYQLYYYPFLRLTTGTTGRKKLTKNALMNAPIKVCSLGEQNKIVQEIESRISVADKMEESITESLQQVEALKQSILKKAFEGNLV